ncbi:MAG: hypothetical protein BroJett011_75480 [Chloroflexota bacterium]|nr:MAG: hypothetical protein BroJett011_75480 [Chloroflexota bacterium]
MQQPVSNSDRLDSEHATESLKKEQSHAIYGHLGYFSSGQPNEQGDWPGAGYEFEV